MQFKNASLRIRLSTNFLRSYTYSGAPKVLPKTPSRISIVSQTLNARLPLKHGSIRCETLRNAFQISNMSCFEARKQIFRLFLLFSCIFPRLLRSYVKTDVTSRFLAIFCSRQSCHHICMTKFRQTYAILDQIS